MSERAAGAAGPARESARSPAVEAKRIWRDYQRNRGGGVPAQELRIGVAASFTADTFVQFVGAHLVSNGLHPAFAVGPYNQLFQACLDPRSSFEGACDVIVLMWRLEDLVLAEISDFLAGDAAAMMRANDKLAALISAIGSLRKAYTGMVVVGVPPYPTGISADPLSLDNARGLGAFHRAMAGRFVDQVGAQEGVHLFDLDALQRQLGIVESFDPRQWYLYRQPFTDRFLNEAGQVLGRIVLASRRTAKKCVVLDCDNTLWGGVVGEDGVDGIQLGDEFPGSAYRDFQKLLLTWRQQGILLAIASKNNEADVMEVFETHDAMVLRREHVSAWQVNWMPKAENIPLIAEALNIGTDSLVFIDDNPMEVAYMQSARPEVTSILLPEEPAEILDTLRKLPLFDRLEITDEDRKRADMMRAEQDRSTLSGALSHDEFLKALELRLDLFRARAEDLGRITQLINKTNQFNLTTIRRTLDEVRVLAGSPDHRLYGLRVSDKFGDYGLTGVVIAEASADRRRWTIDTLLLSCRVLGRGVEAGLIAGLARDAQAEGVAEFIASFVPTKKNALAASFLPDHGFVAHEGGTWHLPLAAAAPMPAHIERAPAAGNRAADAA